MEKNICIIGFGEMGKRHAKDMHEHSNGKVKTVAVCEQDKQRYQQGCEWLGYVPERFTSVAEMLDKVKPDGAIIASPNNTHWDVLRHFEDRNIPLIIEKPLDSTFDKLLKIVDFAKSYSAPIMVHHVMRYTPIVKKAKELISNGVIGELCSFRFCLNGGGGHMHNFRRNKKSGGGQMLEKATHDLDIMLHLMESSPKKVVSICKQQVFGGDKDDQLCCYNCDENDNCNMRTQKGNSQTEGTKDIHMSNDLCVYARSADIADNELCLIELENGTFGSQSNNFFISGYYSRIYEIMGKLGVMKICFNRLPYEAEKTYQGTIEIFPRFGGQYQRFEFNYNKRIHYNGSPGVSEHFNDLMYNKTKKVHSPVDEAFAAEMIAIAAYKSNDLGEYVTIKDILPDSLKESFSRIFDKKNMT